MDALGLTTMEEKIKAMQRIRFPQKLKELETYLGMTGALRHFVEGYSWKAEPLQERKTLLLKDSPIAGSKS